MRFTHCLLGLCALFGFPQVSAAAEPQRWVSAGGSLSEWVVALGGEAYLVGVDSTSQHPASLKALPGIGYQRQLAAEGILTLRPDLLLGTEEMGPPPVLAQLTAAGVRIETLSSAAELPALQRNLTRLGELLGTPPRAAEAFAAYQRQLDDQAQWLSVAQQTQAAPGVLVLLGHAGSSPMAAGQGTAAAWLIERAGGRNLTAHSGYRVLSSEALLALDPEVVVFADRSLSGPEPGTEARAALLEHNPGLAATRAARTGRLLALDPTLLVGGLGPRLPAELAVLAAAFYPAAPAPGHAPARPQP